MKTTNKFKTYLKTGFLLLTVSIFLWSCEKEEVIEEAHQHNLAFKIKDKPFIEFYQKEKFKEAIKYIPNPNYKNKGTLTNSIYNFKIDSSKVREIVYKNKTTYTFLIHRENKSLNSFENLVINIDSLNKVKAYLLKYSPSKDMQNTTIHNSFSFEGDIEVTPIDYKKIGNLLGKQQISCVFVTTVYCRQTGQGPSGTYYYGEHVANSDCQDPDYLISRTRQECFSIDDNDGPNGGSTGAGGTGGGGGTVDDSDIITSPINDPITVRKINRLISTLGLDDTQASWLRQQPQETIESFENFLFQNNNSIEVINFSKEAIKALIEGKEIDFKEMYIQKITSDDSFVYQGTKQLIPSPLVLSNGDKINITFITYTSDNKSSNQKVATELVNSLKFAIENANNNLSSFNKITSINIYATTNGKHGVNSNHTHGSALDINRINGKRMIVSGVTNQIVQLQRAFDRFQYIRENFGPSFLHKYSKEKPIGNRWDYNYTKAGSHKDHIHISVRK